MRENWASLVEKVVNTKFDPSFDYPAERAIVVINDIVDKKWVIKLERLARG